MKKVILSLLLIVFLLLAALLATPFLFKDRINKLLLQKVNEQIEANIRYAGFQLTLLRSFPDFTASFNELLVEGKNAFEGDTLVYIRDFSLRIDLMTVLKKEDLVMKSVSVNNAFFQFITNEDGLANYDIEKPAAAPPVKAADETLPQESVPFKMQLETISLRNVAVVYRSIASNYLVAVQGIDADLSGSLEGMNTLLDISGKANALQIQYHGTDYLKDRSVELATKMLANFDTWEFQFMEGDTRLNNLPLWIEGGFSMPGDSMFFDMNFKVPDMSMAQLIDLVPAEYQSTFDSIDVVGNLDFSGIIKGLYYEEIYPMVDIRFNMHNGKISNSQLPQSVDIHSLDASISMPEGSMDALQVGIQNLDLQLAEHPFKLKANFSNLFVDPHLDVQAIGRIDLATLTNIVPMGNLEMRGLLQLDATVVGNYSALEKNNFSNFVSKGRLELGNFQFKNEQVPQGMNIQKAEVLLKNQDLQINRLEGNIGNSDFDVKGEIKQLITYLFANELLTGNFSMISRKIDVNELLQTDEGEVVAGDTVQTGASPAKKALELPKRVQFNFSAAIDALLYDKMTISNFKGNIELKDQQLTFRGLNMQMLDGILSVDGTVIADGRAYPDVAFGLNIQGFDLPSAHQNLSVVQKYLPIAAKSEGEFSTRLNVKSKLTSDLKMILSDLTANGQFSTKNMKLIDRKTFSGLQSVIQYDKLKNLELDNFTTNFSIANGNLKLDPFKTKLAGQDLKIGGTYNLGGTLNFRVDAQVEKVILSDDIQKMIAYIPGHQRVTKLDVGIDIRGDARKPEVKVDSDQIKQQVINQVKNSSKEEIQDAAKKLIQDFFK